MSLWVSKRKEMTVKTGGFGKGYEVPCQSKDCAQTPYSWYAILGEIIINNLSGKQEPCNEL